MSSSLSNFKTRISENLGLARLNRFRVTFAGIPGWDGNVSDLSLLCDSAILPTRTISTTEYSLHRHTIKVPTGYTENDISITFNLTQNYLAKKALDAWMNSIIDIENYRLKYDIDYRRDITVEQLDTSDNVVYSITAYDAFPTEIEDIEFTNDSEEIAQITATFSYSRFEINNALTRYVGDINTNSNFSNIA